MNLDLCICFGPGLYPTLMVYSDADWIKVPGRKSVSGYVLMLWGGAICWGSRKQRSVSTSTCEAEYIAMSSCAKLGQWAAQILRDMGYRPFIGTNPQTVLIKGNNQGAITLV